MGNSSRLGCFIAGSVAGEAYQAYVPPPLPPTPALELGPLYPLLEEAIASLGRLDGMSSVLPDISLFLYMYIRKEAVLSSQIEGTQSSLSDLLLFESHEAPGAPLGDVSEVSSYVSAMNYGLERLSTLPLSLRLIREIHAKLMEQGRGANKQPGEFRTSQNWIGGDRPSTAKFVPPPVECLQECLSSFENFLHDDSVSLPVLVRAALAHVQFETIHPFLDGNGRVGRLLITLILIERGVLKTPLLYLSLYFKTNRQAYYDHLQAVRDSGNWEEWVRFFLIGVKLVAEQATETAKLILQLFEKDRKALEEKGGGGAVLIVHAYLQKHPITNTTRLRDETRHSLPTILRALTLLEELGIVKEITGKERHKVFIYSEYLDLMNRGVMER